MRNYAHTLRASYLAYIAQAITNNFAPLLFFTLQSTYQLQVEQIAMLVGLNFGTQLLVNLFGAAFADKIGYRPLIVLAQISAALGLIGLGVLPEILPSPYMGLLLSVTLFGIGGGFTEALVSPIVEACPTEKKAASMSLLHSFYCWGLAAVILLSTLFFLVFGMENWRILAYLWALIPLCNTFYFSKVPISQLNPSGEGMSARSLLSSNLFWLLILLMVCAGASEVAMSQWSSFFAEVELGIPKAIGDLAGPGIFAVLMGISRVFYSKFSDKLNLQKFMIGSGCLSVVTYLAAAFSPSPLLGLIAIALCGLSVGVLWPGALSIASELCPKGGTPLFALLALGGTLGCTIGPMAVGMVAGAAAGGIRTGLSIGAAFPVLLIVGIVFLMTRFQYRSDKKTG